MVCGEQEECWFGGGGGGCCLVVFEFHFRFPIIIYDFLMANVLQMLTVLQMPELLLKRIPPSISHFLLVTF